MNVTPNLFATITAAAMFALSAPTLQAQTQTKEAQTAHGRTPAYYVAEFEVTDQEGIKPYRDQVDATFQRYGGRYIVRAAQREKLEGNPPSHRLIVIEFDSIEQARAWYNSPEYAKIRPFRQRSGHTDSYIVEGLPQ